LLFNHESPLRPARYVTQKVVRSAVAIAQGRQEILTIGNLDISRDWGWAPEYVEAMMLMLQQPEPKDLIIATGEAATLRQFAERAFSNVGLDWEKYVRVDPTLFRPVDVHFSRGDARRAHELIGWRAALHWDQVVDRLVEAELARAPA
jgi:GDPmannose 4,6-dehydratase